MHKSIIIQNVGLYHEFYFVSTPPLEGFTHKIYIQ